MKSLALLTLVLSGTSAFLPIVERVAYVPKTHSRSVCYATSTSKVQSTVQVKLDEVTFQQEDDGKGMKIFKAVLEKDVAGTLTSKKVSSMHTRGVEIKEIVTSPKFRGVGLGKALMIHFLEAFLNKGGKIDSLFLSAPSDKTGFFEKYGFVKQEPQAGSSAVQMRGDLQAALEKFSSIVQAVPSNTSTLLNILGRLYHSNQSFEMAGELYTQALAIDPNSSTIFQHLGGAFASQGNSQLAFASFQRAIDLNPTDYSTYLKLGMLYEQLGVGKFREAGDHALKCYEFYLNQTGSQDTDALTMYGNLLQKRLFPHESIKVYKRALDLNPTLHNVWFNLANAQLTLGKKDEAVASLKKTLTYKPDFPSARHLLASLTDEAEAVSTMDRDYVVDLFDFYAPTYDTHMKDSLLYTAPRILRQEVRKLVNKTLITEAGTSDPPDVIKYLNKSLTILDLGCGTGLIGAWFTDYSRHMVGVDISSKMLAQAKKKVLYDELIERDIQEFIADKEQIPEKYSEKFDLVIAADVLNYIGELSSVLGGVKDFMSEKSIFAFTVEDLEIEYTTDPKIRERGYVLGPSGRFMYTRRYIENCLQERGYAIEVAMNNSPRTERGRPVPGLLYLVRRRKETQV